MGVKNDVRLGAGEGRKEVQQLEGSSIVVNSSEHLLFPSVSVLSPPAKYQPIMTS